MAASSGVAPRPALSPSAAWADLQLRRAAFAWRCGDVSAAVELLEDIPFDTLLASPPAFEDAERAIALLGLGYLRLGALDDASALSERVRHAKPASPAAGAIARLTLAASLGTPEFLSETDRYRDALGRELEGDGKGDGAGERRGDAAPGALIARYGLALAAESRGESADAAWREIAASRDLSPLARDLAAAAAIRVAALEAALDRGTHSQPPPADSIEAILARVDSTSLFAPCARLILGSRLIENGQVAEGRDLLERNLVRNVDAQTQRASARRLAALALEEGRWADADSAFRDVALRWESDEAAIQRIAAECVADPSLDPWGAEPLATTVLVFDGAPFHSLAREQEVSAIDLRTRFEVAMPSGAEYLRRGDALADAQAFPPLSPEALIARAQAADDLRASQVASSKSMQRLAAAEAHAARLSDHFLRGRRDVDASAEAIDAASRALAALDLRAEAALLRVEALCGALEAECVARAGEIDRRAERATAIGAGLAYAHAGQRAWAGGSSARTEIDLADSLLREEAHLAGDERTAASAIAANTTGWFAESFRTLWAPALRREIAALASRAGGAIASSAALRALIDERFAAIGSDAMLVALRADASACSLAAANEADVTARVVGETARVALASAAIEIAREGEGIAYGRAVAASEFGFEVARAAADPSRPEARAHADALDADARARFREFLWRYPDSPARDDARFRLAERLAESRTPQDRGEALQIYAALDDDAWDFPRRDAVLFNMGVLLSEEGDSGSSRYFRNLVADFPRSRYCQEAYLRLGDDAFAASDLSGAAESYARAVDGDSRERAAIALYKLGWTRFREERFRDAALAFRDLLDLYAGDAAPALADLRAESEEYLVTALARAGGGRVFADIFHPVGARHGEEQTLSRLSETLARFSQFSAACAADSIWLARYPESPGALDAAAHWIETLELANRASDARRVRLAAAERFAPSGAWCSANASDSLRDAAASFAIAMCEDVARYHHRQAASSSDRDAWREALRIDEFLVATWPDAVAVPPARLNAAMAASSLGEFARALEHAEAAARSGSAAIAEEAAWRVVGIRDQWYESSRSEQLSARASAGDAVLATAGELSRATVRGDSVLALACIDAAEAYAARRGGEARARDALWRAADIALVHVWNARAAALLESFLAFGASDARTPLGARLRARALFEAERFDEAARAYQEALVLAQAEPESIRAELGPMIPRAEFLQIDASQRKGEIAPDEAARRFVEFARNWPACVEADRALYQAGLLFDAASDPASAVAAWSDLSVRYPASELVQDARLASAAALERAGDARAASAALASFALSDRESPDARGALRRAGALLAAARDTISADSLDDVYLATFPDDEGAVFEIRGARAYRELRLASATLSVSAILRGDASANGGSSALGAYLALAAEKPDRADRELLARTAYLIAEEAREACAAVRLTQPIAASVGIKKALLARALETYRECAAHAAPPWDRAAAYRIGGLLVEFGDALQASERPAGLSDDARVSYEEMLEKQSAEFYERGEQAWADLLERVTEEDGDEGQWIEETRCALEDRDVRVGDRAAAAGGGRWGENRANAR
ncbi:MAG: hypothetical protein ACKVU1_06075 [bacterium]